MTVAVRTDHDARAVRALAEAAATPNRARRLRASAPISEGASREDAARSTGPRAAVAARCCADGASALPMLDRPALRDRVHRFHAHGPQGLRERKAPGRSRRWDTAQLAALEARVEAGPEPAQDGLVRWRPADLGSWAEARFQVRAFSR